MDCVDATGALATDLDPQGPCYQALAAVLMESGCGSDECQKDLYDLAARNAACKRRTSRAACEAHGAPCAAPDESTSAAQQGGLQVIGALVASLSVLAALCLA